MSRVEKVSKINKRDTPYIRQVRVHMYCVKFESSTTVSTKTDRAISKLNMMPFDIMTVKNHILLAN